MLVHGSGGVRSHGSGFSPPFSVGFTPPTTPRVYILSRSWADCVNITLADSIDRCKTFDSACSLNSAEYVCFAFNLHL
jgi:hypothetical protein